MRSPATNRDHAADGRCRPGRVPFLTPMLALALAACGTDTGDAGDTGGMTVADSAGVRIVEYAGTPVADASIAFAAEPVYRYGDGPDDYIFSGIRDGVLLGNGGAAVFDSGNREVVLLGPDGTFRSILASGGEGPGDVGFLSSMFALGGDSLLLEDYANSRFTLFVDGSLARTTRIPGVVNSAFAAHGIDADGRWLMSSSGYRRGFPDEWLPGYMVRFDPETEGVDTVATYDYVPFVPPDDVPRNPFPHLGIVEGAGEELLYGRTDIPQIMWRRPDGSVRQIVRWEPERVYPTDQHWELFANDIRETAHTYNPQAQTDEARAALVESMLGRYEMKPEEPLPLFRIRLGDDEGRIWLGEYIVAAKPFFSPSYTLLSRDGEWLGRVVAPDGLRVLDVAGGRVLGIVDDEMGAESVAVYELVGS